MIFDKNLKFSSDQAITATAASTNYIDLKLAGLLPQATAGNTVGQDMGKGNPVPILVQVTTVFDSVADDETLTVSLELDSTTTFTPDKSITLGTFTNAQLKTLGFQLPAAYLPDGITLQYAQLKYTVAGSGNFTAGKITAGIVAGRQTN